MTEKEFQSILNQIAKQNHTTPETVREKMQAAMDAAMASPDPRIQARWAAIPKKGKKLTLAEFIDYCADPSVLGMQKNLH